MKKILIDKKFLQIFLSVLMLLLPATSKAAGWDTYQRVSIVNENKDTLYIENYSNKNLYIRLFVHNRKVSLKYRPPRYQVDQGKIHDLKDEKSLKTAKNRWIRFRLAQDNEYRDSKFLELLQGRKLVFQYYPADKIIKEAVFNLEGIKEAVQTIW